MVIDENSNRTFSGGVGMTAFANQFTGLSIMSKRRPRQILSMQRCPIPPTAQHMSLVEARSSASNEKEKKEKSTSAPKDENWTTGKVRAPRQTHGGGRRERGSVRSQGKKYANRSLQPSAPGLRVAAGTARGRKINSPNVYLRPMMSKVREALFSMLDTLDVLREDGTVLDLYAGSGSVGIEALSRGMNRAVFVDYAQDCLDSIAGNLENCRFADRGQTVRAKVEDFVADGMKYNGNRHYDLITVTPPYEEVDYSELMKAVANSGCVGEGTFVAVEYPVELKSIPPAFEHRLVGIRNRRYGRTVIALYACQPGMDVDPRPDEFIR